MAISKAEHCLYCKHIEFLILIIIIIIFYTNVKVDSRGGVGGWGSVGTVRSVIKPDKERPKGGMRCLHVEIKI